MKVAGFVDVARAAGAALLAGAAALVLRAAGRVDPVKRAAPSPETGRPAPTDGLGDRPGA